MKKPPAALSLLAALCTSAASLFIRFSAMPSMAIALYRMVFSALLLLIPVLGAKGAGFKALSRRDALLCVLSGCALALHFATWISSVAMTTVAASTVLVSCSPVFVALLEWLVFKRKPGKALVLCIAFAGAGTIIIALGGSGGGSASLIGNLLALAGAVFVAVYIIIGSRVRAKVDNATYAFAVYGVSAIVLLVLCLPMNVPLAPYSARDIALAAAMALVCSAGGHTLYNYMLGRVRPILISLASLCEPVFASLLALAILRETPHTSTIAGGAVVLCSLGFYIKNTAKD